MIRLFAALAIAAAPIAVFAQDAAPAEAAAPKIEIDPTAVPNATSPQANLLTGLYATLATIEICAVEVDATVRDGMVIDQRRLERALSMDEAAGDAAYAEIKADVETTSPDCTAGSADLASVDAVTSIYAQQASATPAATAPAAAPAETPAQ
ncbi:MAG TPA: hypothetical protein VGN79_10545 [Devosia sp.]|jgi:hypothetical protein|nr:hypothetical protein [Devosia sp.]